jgi:hypothetical protein
MFSRTLSYDQSNSYHDKTSNFSLSPPQNWIILNVPPSMQSKALAIFSNHNHTGLATMAIFFKPISQQVVSALQTFSDREILSEISNELSYNGTDSKTRVLQLGLQRYQDGLLIKAVSITLYQNDSSNIQNENLIFYLNDGRQYTLLLTSKPQDFGQDQKFFESSADTLYVAPNDNFTQTQVSKVGPTVPEFPFAIPIMLISISSMMVFYRMKFRK